MELEDKAGEPEPHTALHPYNPLPSPKHAEPLYPKPPHNPNHVPHLGALFCRPSLVASGGSTLPISKPTSRRLKRFRA